MAPALQGRPDVVAYKVISQVFNIKLGSAGLDRLFVQTLQLLALSDVAGHRDHFTMVVLFQPRNDDGGVETARVSQYDFLDHALDPWLCNRGCEQLFIP